MNKSLLLDAFCDVCHCWHREFYVDANPARVVGPTKVSPEITSTVKYYCQTNYDDH